MSDEHRDRSRRRLGAALAITFTFFIVEVVGGILSGSLALLADAAHMFTDVGALILSYAAMTLAARPPTERHSFGFFRAEIMAAFVNAEVLLLISGYIFYESYQRLQAAPEIATGIMLWVAVGGLAANLLSMRFLHGGHGASLNVKAAYLEVVTDLLGSLGVIAAALLIALTGWYWIDPVVSAAIGLVIIPRTVSLLRQSAHILLEGTPGEIDVSGLRQAILDLPEVTAVHDLHCWSLTSGLHSASVHVCTATQTSTDHVCAEVQRVLKARAGIEHVTVQVEAEPVSPCGTQGHL